MRVFVALLVLSLVACGKHTKQAPVVAALEKLADEPSQVVLYSLNPENHHDNDPYTDTVFHGYDILGKAEITDRSEQRALLQALAHGASENDDHAMACFNPRHALHIEQNGRSIRAVFSPAPHQSRYMMSRSEATICQLLPKKV